MISLWAWLFRAFVSTHIDVLILLFLAVTFSFYAFSRLPPLFPLICGEKLDLRLFCGFSALCACVDTKRNLTQLFLLSAVSTGRSLRMTALFNLSPNALLNWLDKIEWLCAVISFPFLLALFLFLWRNFLNLLRKCGGKSLWGNKMETAVFAVLFAFHAFAVSWYFMHSSAGYGGDKAYNNLLFGTDSGGLHNRNYFLMGYGSREPVFYVFSAFLSGCLSSLHILPVQAEWLYPLALQLEHLALLLTANRILACFMGRTSVSRCLLMILLSLSFPVLFFGLVIEKYILAYFWLIILVCLCIRRERSAFAVCAAGGTMLPSALLSIFASEHSPRRETKAWLSDMLHYMMCFAASLVLLAPGLVLFRFQSSTVFVVSNMPFLQRFYQYTGLLGAFFLFPAAEVIPVLEGTLEMPHWVYTVLEHWNPVGLAVLAAVIISAVWNRRNRLCQIAAVWAVFSFVLHIVIGFGADEIALYTLYYMWAYVILLYALAERLGDLLGIQRLPDLVCILCIIVFLCVNIPAIGRMIQFSIQYYPPGFFSV